MGKYHSKGLILLCLTILLIEQEFWGRRSRVTVDKFSCPWWLQGTPTAPTLLLVFTAGCSCLSDDKNQGSIFCCCCGCHHCYLKTKQNNARLLNNLTTKQPWRMGSSWSVLLIGKDPAFCAWCGDSKCP